MNYSSQFVHLNSVPMRKIYRLVEQVSETDTPVLITGETGVGKEIIANLIHYSSDRAEKPLTIMNCGEFNDNGLLHSELFGHEKGAFTGATYRRIGLLEQTDTGTLFLDEIGEMHPEVQPKLLRAIENQEFRRVGGSETIKVDVRVIAATNKNLDEEIKNKRFRVDLFYRLNTFSIDIPPLRERREDIATLIDAFIFQLSSKHNKTIIRITPEARICLEKSALPGNIRQLRNAIDSAIITSQNDEIGLEDLPVDIGILTQSKKTPRIKNIEFQSNIPPEIRYILSQISVKEFILIFGEIPNVVWRKLPESTQQVIIREASYHLSKLLGGFQDVIEIDGMSRDEILRKISHRRVEKYGSATKAAESLGIDRRTLKAYLNVDLKKSK